MLNVTQAVVYLRQVFMMHSFQQKKLSEFGGRLAAIYVSFVAGSHDTIMVFFTPMQFKPEKDIVVGRREMSFFNPTKNR